MEVLSLEKRRYRRNITALYSYPKGDCSMVEVDTFSWGQQVAAVSCAKQSSGRILGKKSQKSHDVLEQAALGHGRVNT